MTAMLNQYLGRIQQLGSPVLRVVANTVPPSMFGTSALTGLVRNMVDSMNAANGAGIAAPQIGESWRVFVVHGTGKNPRYPYKPTVPLTVFVNPEIEVIDPTPMHLFEGCLSVPGMRGQVSRASQVRCSAYHLDGTKFVVRAQGHVAGTLQHELDHLDGVLFPDHAQAQGLMTSSAFEEHHRDAFFTYAMQLNDEYPEPLTWELGHAPDADALQELLESAPELTGPAAHGEENADNETTSMRVTPKVAVGKSEAPPHPVTYAAELTWTGGRLERNVYITVGADGRIATVQRNIDTDAETALVALPHRVLLPGFVNAHSHAFQRGLRGLGEDYPTPSAGDPRPSFWTWRNAMYKLVRDLDSKEAFKEQTLQCFREMAAAGITTCGEFHYFHHTSTPSNAAEEDYGLDEMVIAAAREANVRVVLLNACYQRGGFDNRPLSNGQERFQTSDLEKYWEQMDRLQMLLDEDPTRGDSLGAVVHSLRAVDVPALQHMAAEAHRRKLPLHVHLEEQPQEIADCIDAHGVTPLALLLQSVPTHALERLCAVHCTHSTREELDQLIAAGGGVCICPLTEAALGDGVFTAPEATEGVVSLGTDCNARIDMFEEMRWLEYSQRLSRGQRGVFPSVNPADNTGNLSRQLLDCATVHGARHLGIDTGCFIPGQWADFALLDLDAAALVGAGDDTVVGAAIFGGSGEGLVVNSCVSGTWTKAL
eukprot:m.1632352 g.1632352  ORF g.1632352 m.1632352 type:complete len:709 (-) comp25405_c0_seq2:7053-9179(-)